MTALALPALVLGAVLLHESGASVPMAVAALVFFSLFWLIVAGAFVEQIVRPMQTLANVVAALREDDFSFRARGARRSDALGDLALEVNALAGTLQMQRSSALEALTLVERVMTSMQSPVLAFDAQNRLRLHNAAADRAFGLTRQASDGRSADDLNLGPLLDVADEETYSNLDRSSNATRPGTALRYVVRRTIFRLRGVPHVLLVLSDVGAALREEERQAWQRLIRVLGHEINNSLTPIKSIAGSLRGRLPEALPADDRRDLARDSGRDSSRDLNRDLNRGLAVIEDRAASLNRFLQAYQQLSTLPAPRLESVQLKPLLERVIHLEQRIEVQLFPGPELTLFADPDQLQQALINLVQNAVDAALEAALNSASLNDSQAASEPSVQVAWFRSQPRAATQALDGSRDTTPSPEANIRISDNGLGLLNPVNLFVPFYTTKPNGTGIGLALAQQIVIAHKGSVALTNRSDGSGCVAEVRLPAHTR